MSTSIPASDGDVQREARAAATPLHKRLSRRLLQFVPLILFFVLWNVASDSGWINPQAFPSPVSILQATADQFASGQLTANVAASLQRVFVGVLIAVVLGTAAGLLFARFDRLAYFMSPAVELIRPISVIAWIPVAIIWFGLGNQSSWFLIALGAFFPIYTNTYMGVRRIPKVYLQAARTLGLGPGLLVRNVYLPATLPDILTGIRIGLGTGWTCVIAAEMISATSGLGYMIQMARALLETELVFSGMIVIGLIGYGVNWVMLVIEQ